MPIIPVFDADPVYGPLPDPAETAPPLLNDFGLDVVMIDGYPIDAVVSEKHDFDLDVTEYPVERGADIADHVRPKPLKISLDCFVSDLPFGAIAAHQTRQGGTVPSADAYARLLALRNNPREVTVVTSLKSYDSMVLSQLSIPRASGEPTGLHFTVSFIKVLIVQDTRVSIAAAVTAKNAKLSPVASAAGAGIPCYRILSLQGTTDINFEGGSTVTVDNAAYAESAPNYLGSDPDGAYLAAGTNTPPATGVWVIAVNSPNVIAQNQILMSESLPLLHQGYNSFSGNPALVNNSSYVPQTVMLTNRSNAPITQSPGDVSQDAVDAAFKAAGVPTSVPAEDGNGAAGSRSDE